MKTILETVTLNQHWDILTLNTTHSNLPSLLFTSLCAYSIYSLFKFLIKSHTISPSSSTARFLLFLWFSTILSTTLYQLYQLLLLNSDVFSFYSQFSSDLDDETLDSTIPDWLPIFINGLYFKVLFYELGTRLLKLFFNYIPKTHLGSLDGDFIWATLIHSYSFLELFPFVFLKYLQLALHSFYIITRLSTDYKLLTQISNSLNWILFWLRRLFTLYNFIFKSIVTPWLLYVPDTLVLVAAMLFDFGLFAGIQMKQLTETATSPPPPPFKITFDLEREWYHQFLFGIYPDDHNINDNDPPWASEMGHFATSSKNDDSESESSDTSNLHQSEIKDLLKDMDDFEIDDSYLCPDRIYTRQMRSLVVSNYVNNPNIKNSKTKNRFMAKVSHFKQAILNPTSAVSKMVDSLLESRKRINQNESSKRLVCVVCRDAMRDTIILPCRHLCLCSECKDKMESNGLDSCPICFQKIEGNVKIYWS